MKADFTTLSALFAFILNGAGLSALYHLLTQSDTKETVSALRGAIAKNLGDERPGPKHVRKKVEALGAELFSFWMVLLHFLNISILVALVIFLIMGPDKLFSQAEGELAEALTPVQLVVYWTWFFLSLIAYMIKGVSPSLKWWRLWREGKAWLREEEGRRARKRK